MKNKIAEYRNKLKLSQLELAQRVGISRPYLSEIERGIKSPGVIIAKNICLALGASFEAIFFNNNVNHSIQSTGTNGKWGD